MATRKPNTKDPADVARAVVDLVDEANAQRLQRLFHTGKRFNDVVLTSSNLEINHGLGRVPEVVVPLKLNAGEVVYSDTPHSNPFEFIYIRATGNVTANLLVA